MVKECFYFVHEGALWPDYCLFCKKAILSILQLAFSGPKSFQNYSVCLDCSLDEAKQLRYIRWALQMTEHMSNEEHVGLSLRNYNQIHALALLDEFLPLPPSEEIVERVRWFELMRAK